MLGKKLNWSKKMNSIFIFSNEKHCYIFEQLYFPSVSIEFAVT